MCFAPQRRALFRHRNFQKWSEPGVFCTCWLQNVLRTTTACKFSSLIWPAGSAPAALASLLFDPPDSGATNHRKNTVFRDFQCFTTFLPFRAPASISLHLLSSDLVSSDCYHLCFSTVHIVGSLTSKLPSISIGLLLIRIPWPMGHGHVIMWGPSPSASTKNSTRAADKASAYRLLLNSSNKLCKR